MLRCFLLRRINSNKETPLLWWCFKATSTRLWVGWHYESARMHPWGNYVIVHRRTRFGFLEWMNTFKLNINVQVCALFDSNIISECCVLFLATVCGVVVLVSWHEIENTGFRNESTGGAFSGVAFSATGPVNFKCRAPPFYLFPIKYNFGD